MWEPLNFVIKIDFNNKILHILTYNNNIPPMSRIFLEAPHFQIGYVFTTKNNNYLFFPGYVYDTLPFIGERRTLTIAEGGEANSYS